MLTYQNPNNTVDHSLSPSRCEAASAETADLNTREEFREDMQQVDHRVTSTALSDADKYGMSMDPWLQLTSYPVLCRKTGR
jgi:hypothetical protein